MTGNCLMWAERQTEFAGKIYETVQKPTDAHTENKKGATQELHTKEPEQILQRAQKQL